MSCDCRMDEEGSRHKEPGNVTTEDPNPTKTDEECDESHLAQLRVPPEQLHASGQARRPPRRAIASSRDRRGERPRHASHRTANAGHQPFWLTGSMWLTWCSRIVVWYAQHRWPGRLRRQGPDRPRACLVHIMSARAPSSSGLAPQSDRLGLIIVRLHAHDRRRRQDAAHQLRILRVPGLRGPGGANTSLQEQHGQWPRLTQLTRTHASSTACTLNIRGAERPRGYACRCAQ
ncbi:hypothetical protein N9L68_02120 [bacterium]|nr:hypothetical protein [bacterium]